MIGAIPDTAREIRERSGVATISDDNEPEQWDPDNVALSFVIWPATMPTTSTGKPSAYMGIPCL